MDNVEQGCLACPVRTYDSENFSPWYFEAYVIQRYNPAKGFSDINYFEDGVSPMVILFPISLLKGFGKR